jgi:DNA-binding GntR family transcriptional regulator
MGTGGMTTTPRTRTADALRRTIEADIISGALAPGERLDETLLAARFGVSRTPVREALLQLASSGLIEMRPRQGALVAKVSAKQLFEMFEVMSELEAQCARLAARRMTDADRVRLTQAYESCRTAAEAGNADDYYDANQVFHEVIYQGSHNGFLEEQTLNLRNRLAAYRRIQLRRGRRIQSSLREHEAVMDAILAQKDEAAGEAMRGHVMIQGDGFVDLLSSLETEESETSRLQAKGH